MLRVLLITREPWRDDSNEGSVLSSWFENQPMELAQIYCKPGLPDNKCCQRYFQLTDKMAAKNLLRREPMGKVIDLAGAQAAGTQAAPPVTEQEKKAFYDFFRRHNWTLFFLMREWLWGLANWKSDALKAFVDDFAPDVIVAPLCYSRYVMAIQRWAAKRLNKPMAGIVWDDLYSFKQWRFSPLFWLNRFLQRRSVRKTVEACKAMYTLCDQQAQVFDKQFGRPFGVFAKVGEENTPQPQQKHNECVQFLYGGGVYYGRQETLAQVVSALDDLNRQGHACRLDVYTNSPDASQLEKENICQVHAAVSAEELKTLYRNADVALHVEGFDKKNATATQYSFSSKIVDCLSAGCAVMAVCPESNCGFRYLQAQKAALCVADAEEIRQGVARLVTRQDERTQWAERAAACAAEQHAPAKVRAHILKQLEELHLAAENE